MSVLAKAKLVSKVDHNAKQKCRKLRFRLSTLKTIKSENSRT